MNSVTPCTCQCHKAQENLPQAAPANNPVAEVAQKSLSGQPQTIGYKLEEIKAIDLTEYRKNPILSPSTWIPLALLPVIGWIALIIVEIDSRRNHRATEKMLRDGSYDA